MDLITRISENFSESAHLKLQAMDALAGPIAAAAEREGCDLIAMATHGHRGLADVMWGTVASELRHRTFVPVLMVRMLKDDR